MKKTVFAAAALALLASPTFASVAKDGQISATAPFSVAKMRMAKVAPTPGVATQSVQIATNSNPSPVPLPAAGWMLLAGLGGIVALRRSRKA